MIAPLQQPVVVVHVERLSVSLQRLAARIPRDAGSVRKPELSVVPGGE